MTEQEYRSKLKELEKDYLNKKKGLHIEYAISNNTVKKGDIVKDHIKTIIVEKIDVSIDHSTSLPECVYEGLPLTKKGEPRKDGKKSYVFQSNII